MNELYECAFFNGGIFTSNPEQPYANAMAVSQGKIVWIGDQSELDTEGKSVVDLHGKRVIPGLIDAHMHPYFTAMVTKQVPCLPPVVNSIKEFIDKIRERIASQEKDEWIESWGYDEGKLAEKRAPLRNDLDEASTEVPVVATRTCGHIISVNSKALEIAGITKDTPDPKGGKIDKDENGEPTGILQETARNLVLSKIPKKELEESADLLVELSPKLFSYGITAVTELYARTQPLDYLTMYDKAKEKGYKHRTALYYIWEDITDAPTFTEEQKNRENQNHIGGIKLIADGSVSGHTAWVKEPFVGGNDDYGIQTCFEDELLTAVESAKENSVQLIVHAMGDQAIDFVVDTLYQHKPWIEDGPSIRIEHATLPSEQTLKRSAEAGIAFVPQPIFLYAEIESYLKNLGVERTKKAYPIKTMLEAGLKVAISSDAPATALVDPINPYVGLHLAVNRIAYDGTDTGQDERIDITTAIELHTRVAQEITRIPNIGQLKPGYYADFVVLDQDILQMDSIEIVQVQVDETYIGGELVYQNEQVKS
ncbi:amidohydrolase [Salipaludibacillus sp. CF4.18]|uniref:amidohydrolase n=1 Tax=Salipaludibacillus sp. CF4.18 TaxID=3373081 RepID=UPI003EE6CA71